jgi:hypothetical protein
MTLEIDPSAQPASFIRKILLRLMLVLIAIGVAVAIIAVLRGEPLGETMGKVLNTAMGTGFFAALALACADVAERKPSLLAYGGIVAACVGVAVFFVGIWFEQARFPWWWKALAVSTLYSLALWRCARFTLAELTGMGGVVVKVTMLACLGIATTIAMMILHENAAPGLVRAMNAMWILAIGGHVAVPILMKLRKSGTPPPTSPPTSPPTPPPSPPSPPAT